MKSNPLVRKLLSALIAIALLGSCSSDDAAEEGSSDDAAEEGSSDDAAEEGEATASLPSIDVLTQVEGKLGAVGLQPDLGTLTCPAELESAAGASVRCEFLAEGQPVDLIVQVVEVVGDDVSIRVETEARAVPKTILEERVRFRIEREMNRSLTSIECDGALEPEVGASARCTLGDEDLTREVTATVDNVEDGLIGLSIND